MLDALRNLFDKGTGSSPARPDEARHALEVAAATLLVEVARSDGTLHASERTAVLHAIHEKFALTGTEAEDLLVLAERERQSAVGFYPFTSLINQRFSQAQKERLIELMWRAAYADQDLSAHELHLMRKIAGLLHVPDNAYIAAKLRAKEASGSS